MNPYAAGQADVKRRLRAAELRRRRDEVHRWRRHNRTARAALAVTVGFALAISLLAIAGVL